MVTQDTNLGLCTPTLMRKRCRYPSSYTFPYPEDLRHPPDCHGHHLETVKFFRILDKAHLLAAFLVTSSHANDSALRDRHHDLALKVLTPHEGVAIVSMTTLLVLEKRKEDCVVASCLLELPSELRFPIRIHPQGA